MAEAGSFAEKVKQQADIVRVIGEYVRLKKTGQNFTGLCPFHQEKSPSFAVHPVPRPREHSPEERRENQQRSVLIDMHREAAALFSRHLHESAEGRVACGYL